MRSRKLIEGIIGLCTLEMNYTGDAVRHKVSDFIVNLRKIAPGACAR